LGSGLKGVVLCPSSEEPAKEEREELPFCRIRFGR
jgi:hypothetical protein